MNHPNMCRINDATLRAAVRITRNTRPDAYGEVGREWTVSRKTFTVGTVRFTKGGFYRAYSYLAGSGYGPFFSFTAAARFALNG